MDAIPRIHHQAEEDFGPGWAFAVSGSLISYATKSAPVARLPKQFPVVLFSHGVGSTGFAYTSLIEDLVSHGYGVASIECPDTAIAFDFRTGCLYRPGKRSLPPIWLLSNDLNKCRLPPDARSTRGHMTLCSFSVNWRREVVEVAMELRAILRIDERGQASGKRRR
jgi:hypothetical protein